MKENVGCIYEITCSVTKKKYIGRSIYEPEQRFLQHVEKSRNINSDCYDNPLQEAIREYGPEKFKVRLLASCIFKEYQDLNAIEQIYIQSFNTLYPNGYNVSGLKDNKFVEYRTMKG